MSIKPRSRNLAVEERVIDEIITQIKVYLLPEIKAIKINIRWHWVCIIGRSELAWLEWSSLGRDLKERYKLMSMWRVGEGRSISGGFPSVSEVLDNPYDLENIQWLHGLMRKERRLGKNFNPDPHSNGKRTERQGGYHCHQIYIWKRLVQLAGMEQRWMFHESGWGIRLRCWWQSWGEIDARGIRRGWDSSSLFVLCIFSL